MTNIWYGITQHHKLVLIILISSNVCILSTRFYIQFSSRSTMFRIISWRQPISSHCRNRDQGKTRWDSGWPRRGKSRLRHRRSRFACRWPHIRFPENSSGFSCKSDQRPIPPGFLGSRMKPSRWEVRLGGWLGGWMGRWMGRWMGGWVGGELLLWEQVYEANVRQFLQQIAPHILLWCWEIGSVFKNLRQN